MDATALALSWLLFAQVPASPFSGNYGEVTIPSTRQAAPPAMIQDDNVSNDRPAWNGGGAHGGTNRVVPIQNTAPAWNGGGSQSESTGRFNTSDNGTYPNNNLRATTTGPVLGNAAQSTRAAASTGRLFGLRRAGETANSGNNFSSALLVPLASRSGNRLPSEVLAHAMSPPQGSNLAGRQVSLMEVLSRTTDRKQQFKATQAYWRLLMAEAEFYWQADEAERMEQIVPYKKGKVSDENALKMARNAAWGRLREAELHVLTAQHEVADLIRLDDFEMLPLAADQPLIGPYKSYFRELFANREPPGHTRLIAANLPVRLKLIETRTEAVFDAADGVRLAVDEHNGGQLEVRALVECINDLREERHDFLMAVREYNDDVAEYAITVASPGASNATLVGMMIKTNNLSAQLPRTRLDNNSSYGSQNGYGNNGQNYGNNQNYGNGTNYDSGQNNNGSQNYNNGSGYNNSAPSSTFGNPNSQRQPARSVRPTDYQEESSTEILRRPATSVSPSKRRDNSASLNDDRSTFAEPALLPEEILRTSNRVSPNQPVSVLARPIRD